MGSVRRRLFHQAGCPLDGRGPRDADAALARTASASFSTSGCRARRFRTPGAPLASKLVVLDAGDPGVVVERAALAADGLQQILRKNLDAIVAAAAGQ